MYKVIIITQQLDLNPGSPRENPERYLLSLPSIMWDQLLFSFMYDIETRKRHI